MDTKFSVAIHVLILISEFPSPINSDQIAASVGTNASYIRKVLTLLKIYQSVTEEPEIHLLDVHQNPGDQCVVGRHIKPMLAGMFADMEKTFARALAGKTLADCIDGIRKEIDVSI